jgi:hypothetical protein
MQNAPSVVYPVGHSAFYRRGLVALGAIGLAAIAGGWLLSVNESPTGALHLRWVAGLVLCGIWMALALRSFRRAEVGSIRWDALAPASDVEARPGAWFWSRGRAKPVMLSSTPERIYDGQHWLLLRLQGADGSGRWIWVERRLEPLLWDDFRRALVSST